jgi:hypothetical protein
MGWLVLLWIVCAFIGWHVGKAKGAEGTGAMLGFVLGPIGVLMTMAIDNRTCCPICGTRLNGHPQQCPQCSAHFAWQMNGPKFRYVTDEEYKAGKRPPTPPPMTIAPLPPVQPFDWKRGIVWLVACTVSGAALGGLCTLLRFGGSFGIWPGIRLGLLIGVILGLWQATEASWRPPN